MLKNTRGPQVKEIIGRLKPAYLGASQFVLLGTENKENQLGGACNTHGREHE